MNNFDKTLNKILKNCNLATEEAEQAMTEIMSGKVSEIKLSSWLTALRMKGESPEEIAGCASAMIKNAEKIKINNKNAIDIVGTGGDTSNTVNISTASAIVASAAGLTVAKHGNKAVSSKSGSADVLSSLGVNVSISPKQMEDCVNKINLGFLFAPLLHPAMKYAAPVRKELGIRTIFNILGPLCNPACVKKALIGVYAPHLCRQIALAAKNLGFKHVMVVHGNDGLDEITLTTRTIVCEFRDNHLKEYEINPMDFGFKLVSLKEFQGGNAEFNARILKEVFNNNLTGPVKDIIILNSAAALIIGDKTENWHEAVKLADSIIETGKAYEKLNSLIEMTKSFN